VHHERRGSPPGASSRAVSTRVTRSRCSVRVSSSLPQPHPHRRAGTGAVSSRRRGPSPPAPTGPARQTC